MSKAELQNSVLTNRIKRSVLMNINKKDNKVENKPYKRHLCTDKQAHHCKALRVRKCKDVDTAGMEGKKMPLPREVSKVTCNYMEKSVPKLRDHSTQKKRGAENCIGLTIGEGLNIILFKTRTGALVVAYA